MKAGFDISIVLSSFNRDDEVLKTIHSLFRSDLAGFQAIELIIIDDGSPRPLKNLVPLFGEIPECISWRLVTQENSGIGATRNRGYREALSQYILFLDDDIILQEGTLRQILNAQREHGGAVIFGNYPFITHHSPSLEIFARHLYGYDLMTREVSFDKVNALTSGFLLVNKEKLKGITLFYKDDMTIPAAEEYELIARFHRMGIPIYRANHICVLHNHHFELKWMVVQQYKYGQGTAEALAKDPGISELEIFTGLKAKMDALVRGGINNMARTVIASAPGRKFLLQFARLVEKLLPGRNHNRLYGITATAYYWAGYIAGWKKFSAHGKEPVIR